MTDWIGPQLSASLDAWRLSSRRTPRRHAVERAHDAMLEAVLVESRRPHARRFLSFSFRPRFRYAGLIATTATIVAAASVAAAGWNAAPGSALFVVRAARQGVMLKLPGADDIALHLEFAEQSLADAKEHVNPAQSLADATTELHAAFTELSVDPSSPLWPRYKLDAATLLSEEGDVESERPSPAPTGETPGPTGDDSPSSSASERGDDETARPTAGHDSAPSPTGSRSGGNDGGGSNDGGSPSPGQTPHPDD